MLTINFDIVVGAIACTIIIGWLIAMVTLACQAAREAGYREGVAVGRRLGYSSGFFSGIESLNKYKQIVRGNSAAREAQESADNKDG